MAEKAKNVGDPYFIDFPKRIESIQEEMQKANLDVYFGSRLRTISWTIDTFCPWRSYVLIFPEGPRGRLRADAVLDKSRAYVSGGRSPDLRDTIRMPAGKYRFQV